MREIIARTIIQAPTLIAGGLLAPYLSLPRISMVAAIVALAVLATFAGVMDAMLRSYHWL